MVYNYIQFTLMYRISIATNSLIRGLGGHGIHGIPKPSYSIKTANTTKIISTYRYNV